MNSAETSELLVRWRGRQEGTYSMQVIESRLAANEIGLLHEVSYQGKWTTLRQYLVERDAALRTEAQLREDQQRREREEQARDERLADEMRRNELRASSLSSQIDLTRSQAMLMPHRGGMIFALSLGGVVLPLLSIAAWIMGTGDLRNMDIGIMDPRGASLTRTGRNLGAILTVLWIAAAVLYFIH